MRGPPYRIASSVDQSSALRDRRALCHCAGGRAWWQSAADASSGCDCSWLREDTRARAMLKRGCERFSTWGVRIHRANRLRTRSAQRCCRCVVCDVYVPRHSLLTGNLAHRGVLACHTSPLHQPDSQWTAGDVELDYRVVTCPIAFTALVGAAFGEAGNTALSTDDVSLAVESTSPSHLWPAEPLAPCPPSRVPQHPPSFLPVATAPNGLNGSAPDRESG